MTTTDSVASAEIAPVDEPPFSPDEQAALAGILAGYSGLTRDAYGTVALLHAEHASSGLAGSAPQSEG